MKNLMFLFILATGLLLSSCGSEPPAEEGLSQDRLSELIQGLQGALEEQKDQPRVDSATIRTLVDRVEEYARRFPQDTLTPKFLFRTAAASRGIGDFEKAVELWGRITVSYENYKRAPEALFLQGLTLDENLADTGRARQQYEAFLERYPKHPLANDARLLLEAARSGKSGNDLVKEFQQKQEEE